MHAFLRDLARSLRAFCRRPSVPRSRPWLMAWAIALAVAAAPGQEQLAVDSSGVVLAVPLDGRPLRVVHVSAMGFCQASAHKGDALDPLRSSHYVAAHDGIASRIYEVDGFTGVETLAVADAGAPIVALADVFATSILWGIADGVVDRLVRIDVVRGTVVDVGPTGFTELQGLEIVFGVLFGWDAAAGLVRIDSATGAAVDVAPTVGSQGQNVQFLGFDEFHRVLGGADELFFVDITTGLLHPTGVSGLGDVRGADYRTGLSTFFGVACATPRLRPSLLLTQGSIVEGGVVHFLSQGHTPGAPSLLALGLPATTHQGQPLPLPLDPLLGTNGCSLWVSPMATLFGVAAATGRVDMPVRLTGLAGVEIDGQMFVFEAVPGGLSASDARRLRVPN